MKRKRETRGSAYGRLPGSRGAAVRLASPGAVRRAWAGAGFLLLAGCAAVTTVEGERLPIASPRFAEYVEGVFREQNRIATELAFALEDADDPEAVDILDAAEGELLGACAGLNELAAARRDGERLGFRRRLDAAQQAPECERAAAEAAEALERAEAGAQSGSRRPTATR